MVELPSLDNLRCFVVAAEQLHFRRAAKIMSLTPAAFGQRIKQLEEQLGQELFVRSTRHVALTRAGMKLMPLAQETLAQASACVEALHPGALEEVPVKLVLGTRFELGLSWLVPAIARLPESFGYMDVHFYFGSGDDILEQLAARQVDAVITSAPVAHSDWTSHFLHREEYLFVASPELLARQPFVSVDDARAHTLLDIHEGLPLMRYLDSVVAEEFCFRKVRSCGAGGAMLELALQGLGVAVLPRYMVAPFLEQGALSVVLPQREPLSDAFRMIARKDSVYQDDIKKLSVYLAQQPLC